MSEILVLLEKLIEVNNEYQKSNNARRIKLFDACDYLFQELETLGVASGISEAVAVFGNEFTVYEFGLPVGEALARLLASRA